MAELTSGTLKPLQRLIRLLRAYHRETRFILLYAMVAGLINLSLPLGIQAIIGQLMGGSINAAWTVLVLFVLVGVVLTGVLRLFQLSVMEFMQRRLFSEMAVEFAARIPRLNLDLLRKEHLPELVNRFFDTTTLQKGLPKLLIDGSTALLQILFSLVLLSFYHAGFLAFSLLMIGILFALFYATASTGMRTSLQESKYKYQLVFWLEEIGRVAGTFKMIGKNNFPLLRADAITANYLDARAKHWRILMIKFIGSATFRLLSMGSFLILGSLLVMQNQLNLGQFVAAEILVFLVIEAVEKLVVLHEIGYDVLTATEKLGQFADLPLEPDGGIQLQEFSEPNKPLSVELRELSYQFQDSPTPVLKSLNLKIEPGQKVAITGYNASGKSILQQILSITRRDFTGSLLFNGLPEQNLDLRSLRHRIGDFSLQEDIFKATLAENITFEREDISLRRVLDVAEKIGLGDFLRNCPMGLATELQSGGKNLPGSVIAKIMIARAIVAEPNLLVMEDPTARLNLRDRMEIAKLLTSSEQPWTLVCVSEDPVLAAMCDRLLILKDGEIIFDGSYEAAQKTEDFDKVFRAPLI